MINTAVLSEADETSTITVNGTLAINPSAYTDGATEGNYGAGGINDTSTASYDPGPVSLTIGATGTIEVKSVISWPPRRF